ncbi:MAG: serine hydrolase [Bryobacteraceae bacterium]
MRLRLIVAGAALTASLVAALPGPWPRSRPEEAGMDAKGLEAARDFAMRVKGSGYVIRRGRLVYAWGDPKQRYDLKSTTKSIGVTALGLALLDAKIRLEDRAVDLHPQFGVPPESNADTGWLPRITVQHLATQTAGFDKKGDYQPLLFAPGTQWAYSDGGPNWLAECLTLAYRRDMEELLFERVFTPLGITHEDLAWRKNAYRPALIDGIARREFGSGVHANVDAMARIGLLYLREGRFGGKQILPASFVRMARSVTLGFEDVPVMRAEDYPNAARHYGLLWWNNNDGSLAGVPSDAFWSWGLYDSLIVVIPSLDLVVARAGEGWGEHAVFSRLEPFLRPIVESVRDRPRNPKPPYPPSPVIETIRWAPADTIVRRAAGSDNWPTTWGDDDAIYTAYGDGYGFEPLLKEKLGLGFAKLVGAPGSFEGINIRSASGENKGSGANGKKASGLLMVKGVLWMLVRNAGNAQLAWSSDHAKTWTWSDWKFTTSFGHPTFLNFGRNYAGARDGYVYVYSTDADTAYLPSSRMILARAPADRMRERAAWEFFERVDSAGQPQWSADIEKRGAVFENAPYLCYRTQVSYNAGLKRYILTQILPGEAPRFQGGFGVYDAPEPWGPWTTAFFTERWDVGPGESSNFPTKWMSEDGRTLYLVSSGEDHFSLRRADLQLR